MQQERTRRGAASGPANHNWKGGRTIASNGYVLVRRPGHPLADVRGYAYEHRLVACQMLGRLLLPSEEVHHGPGGKQDNRPENLTICATKWEHQQHHSSRPGRTLEPGQPNPLIVCGCGCGHLLTAYDRYGRPRLYVWGHNRQTAPSQDAIVAAVAGGAERIGEIVARTGLTETAVKVALTKMVRAEVVRRVARGRYAPRSA